MLTLNDVPATCVHSRHQPPCRPIPPIRARPSPRRVVTSERSLTSCCAGLLFRSPKAPIAVLGPGTGLGEAILTWDSGADGYKARRHPPQSVRTSAPSLCRAQPGRGLAEMWRGSEDDLSFVWVGRDGAGVAVRGVTRGLRSGGDHAADAHCLRRCAARLDADRASRDSILSCCLRRTLSLTFHAVSFLPLSQKRSWGNARSSKSAAGCARKGSTRRVNLYHIAVASQSATLLKPPAPPFSCAFRFPQSGLARIYRFLRAYQGQYGLPAELSPAAVSEKGACARAAVALAPPSLQASSPRR